MHTTFDKYYPITKIWAFFRPIVSIRHPDDLEVMKYKRNSNLENYDIVKFKNLARKNL